MGSPWSVLPFVTVREQGCSSFLYTVCAAVFSIILAGKNFDAGRCGLY
jgi:hypothetical protein